LFPNINKDNYYKYVNKLESLIKKIYQKQRKIIVAADYNEKTAAWGGDKTDKRGRTLARVS
jgi:hypothetical protein